MDWCFTCFQNADTERQRRRLSPDAQLLGEMVFGSVEMTYKGPTVKVHSIRYFNYHSIV